MKLRNARSYIERFLKIRNKQGRVIPLILNPPQLRLYEAIKSQWDAGLPIRIIILKARQMGFSTLTAALIFFLVATSFNVTAMVVAHKDDATKTIFTMYRLFYALLPERLRPQSKANNGYTLEFNRPAKSKSTTPGLNSVIKCATAGGDGIGRSETVQYLHLSEYAFWPGDPADTYLGIAQTVPDEPGTMIVIESTAKGFNDFKKKWDLAVKGQAAGDEGFIPIFFAWHEMPGYRRRVPPGFVRTAQEQELAEAYGLDDEQLVWRRWTINTKCGGDEARFRQEYPASPDEAFIASGRCVFDKERLVLARERAKAEKWVRGEFVIQKNEAGKIVSFRWREDPKGAVRMRRTPETGVPYVLGADTAGTGSDRFAGHVLDNRTGEQVAVLHHQYGERYFAEQAYCLGMHYNTALIGVEINYSTYPEKVLEELGYPRLYVRQKVDDFTGKIINAYGFETTTRTRPLIVDGLKDVAARELELIRDYDTLGEMLTFVYDEDWKPQAEEGEHDDLVMSLAIAHFIRPQQSYQAAATEAGKKRRWTEDMLEDYYQADTAGRARMERRWGKPDDDEDEEE